MRVVLFLSLIVAILGSNAHAQVCGAKITSFYRNAELNQFPAMPHGPISDSEAERLEERGDTYYIHVVCESGDPVSLTKRWNQKMYFIIKYLYQDGKLIGQKSINANGEMNEYYIN